MEGQQLDSQFNKNYKNRYKKLFAISFAIAVLLFIFWWVSSFLLGFCIPKCPNISSWLTSYELRDIIYNVLTILWILSPYIIIILIVIAVVSLILHYKKREGLKS